MTADTEGSELAILKTIDFGRIYVDYVQVEALQLGQTREHDNKNKNDIISYMASNGFKHAATLPIASDTVDLLFENTVSTQTFAGKPFWLPVPPTPVFSISVSPSSDPPTLPTFIS